MVLLRLHADGSFVVATHSGILQWDKETAMQIMLKVHVEGRGVLQVYTKDVALTKVELV